MASVYKKYTATWDRPFYVRGVAVKPGETVELTDQEAADLQVRIKSVILDKKTGKTGLTRMVEIQTGKA